MSRPLHEVETLFQAVIELPEPERARFLDRCCAGDPGLRREVESLVMHFNDAEAFVDFRMRRAADNYPRQARARIGQRVGAYRIQREIGCGGMGAVYLATRVDGQFHQRVAIKLVRCDVDSQWAADRFRYERQVLAGLSHPNIARLFDGGSTRDGVPYLVMEYIEGQAVTKYCWERNLPTNARLKLFLGVCDAVSEAHRNLIVHRDIKPGNILITEEGTPKLLDFGISKLLDPVDSATAAAGDSATVKLMTPAYASPEQVRGEKVTTATDVYSLGTVLYEILTGKPAYHLDSVSLPEIERVICQSDPPRPSQVAGREFAGDIDNIILRAMHKDPTRRYSSVEQLAADISRYLAGLPVSARQDTVAYRCEKFVKRHKAGVIAAVLLTLTIIGGVAATAWQTKRLAEQILNSERRFLQFRKLANAFLFDFHDKIQNLKDLSEARQLVLDTGIQYMDGLAKEAHGGDPMLSRELARAYEKLGDVQGFRQNNGLGRPVEALVSYRKAIALLEPVFHAGKADTEGLVLLSRSYCSAGEAIEQANGDRVTARDYFRKCLDTGWLATGWKRSRRFLSTLVRAQQSLGDAELAAGNRAAAMEYYSLTLRLIEPHKAKLKTSADVWIGETKLRIAKWQAAGKDYSAATVSFQEAITAGQQALATDSSINTRRLLVAANRDLSLHAARLREQGKPAPDPAPLAREALRISESLAAEFPRHPLIRADIR